MERSTWLVICAMLLGACTTTGVTVDASGRLIVDDTAAFHEAVLKEATSPPVIDRTASGRPCAEFVSFWLAYGMNEDPDQLRDGMLDDLLAYPALRPFEDALITRMPEHIDSVVGGRYDDAAAAIERAGTTSFGLCVSIGALARNG